MNKKKIPQKKKFVSLIPTHLGLPDYETIIAKVKLGNYYKPSLLPDYSPNDFNLKNDKLVQQNIIGSDDKLIPCWDNFNRLRPGTLVLCIVSLRVWNIGIGNRQEGRFKRVSLTVSCSNLLLNTTQIYTLNAQSVRVLKDSSMPTIVPPAKKRIRALSPSTAPSDAQDEFDKFSPMKKIKTDAENVPRTNSSKPFQNAPYASSSKLSETVPHTSTSQKPSKRNKKTTKVDDMDTAA